MRLGVITPVLFRLPGAHARWEETASFDDVVRVVQSAEELGYHHVTCGEHIAVPRDVAEVRGATYWDPLATFGYLAARTSTIRFATHVLVLGYHHPLDIAKRYGTLDQVSGGRLILGVGVGSLEEEFALLGAPFADRGDRADDALRALRASLSQLEPEYHGSHYDYEGLLVDPPALQSRVPIWVGGRTARSLRRAVELADGWAPFGLRREELAEMIAAARDTDAWARREQSDAPPFEFIVQNERPFDPSAEPELVRDAVGRLQEAGTTMINVRFVHHSLDHYCEQLLAMADVAAEL